MCKMAHKNGEAVVPVGGETSAPRFLAVVRFSNLLATAHFLHLKCSTTCLYLSRGIIVFFDIDLPSLVIKFQLLMCYWCNNGATWLIRFHYVVM